MRSPALDHVVVNTPIPERAAALYGARLGLRLALDRSNPDWDMRLMFFRVGGLTIELAHKISGGVSNAPDKLWGLSLARAGHRGGARAAGDAEFRRHLDPRRAAGGHESVHRAGRDDERADAGDFSGPT